MSGGGSQQPTQTTTTQLSPQAQNLVNMAMPGIQSFAARVPQRYQGSTVAGFTPTQEAGQGQLLQGAGATQDIADWAKTGVTGLPGQLQTSVPGTAPYTPGAPLHTSSDIFNDPGIWNPQYNTGFRSAIEAAQRPTWQALTEQALPAIRSSFGPGPQSTRQGIAEGLAIDRGTRGAGDIAAKITGDVYGQNLNAANSRYATNLGAEGQRYGQDVAAETARYGTNVGAEGQRYGQNINAMLAAYGMAPSLQQQQLVPGATTSAVGDVEQALQQAILSGDVSAWNYDQMAPFLQAKEIMALAQGLPTTTTSTGNVPQANSGMQALGGAAAGAGVGGAVGGPMGAGVGALGGAMLPFLFNR